MQSNAFKMFFLHLQEDIQVVVFAVQEEGYSSTSVQGLGQKGMKRGDLGRRFVLRIRFEFFFFYFEVSFTGLRFRTSLNYEFNATLLITLVS